MQQKEYWVTLIHIPSAIFYLSISSVSFSVWERNVFPLLLFGFFEDLSNLSHVCSFWSTWAFSLVTRWCVKTEGMCVCVRVSVCYCCPAGLQQFACFFLCTCEHSNICNPSKNSICVCVYMRGTHRETHSLFQLKQTELKSSISCL